MAFKGRIYGPATTVNRRISGAPLLQAWCPKQVQQLARSCWTRLGFWRLLGAKEELDRPSSTTFTSSWVAVIYSTKARLLFQEAVQLQF